jgi:hypothetical protein
MNRQGTRISQNSAKKTAIKSPFYRCHEIRTVHPPFAYRAAYEAAGWRPIAPHEREISEIDRRWPRNVDKECVSPLREYARELRKLEAQDARPKMRRVATGAFPGHAWQGGTPNQISREDWNVGGDKAGRPAYSVLQTDQLPPTIWRLFRNILATSPGRPRGRPPLGDRRMSDTERQRKRRAKWKTPKPASAPFPKQTTLAPGQKAGGVLSNQRTNAK